MNIIQQQELARNSSEQQLINLASQPNPSIMPPYLVTGELMRRKSIREKFAQAPQQSVSEEVLAEAIGKTQPQGIGALTNNMQAPMVAPQEEVMSESITETGVAQLPAPNIGQNYANGGIVGYENGGGIDFTQTDIDETIYNPNTDTMVTDDLTLTTAPTVGVTQNPYFPYANEVASTYGMPQEPDVANYKEYLNQKKEAFGIGNKYYDDEREAIKTEREQIKEDKDDALNYALIKGGLGMASGTTGNFLQDLTAGTTTGFESYTKDIEDIKNEEKLLRKEDRLVNKSMRAEALGDIQGFETYNKEIRATQLKLIEIGEDKLAKLATAGIARDTAEYDLRKDSMAHAIDVMGGMYGSNEALITKWGPNKKGYNQELIKNFRLRYNTLSGGRDLPQGELDRLLELVWQPQGVVQTEGLANTPKDTQIDPKIFWKNDRPVVTKEGAGY